MGNSYQQLIVSFIGEIGRMQVLIIIIAKLATAVVAFAMVVMSFNTATPKWTKQSIFFNETSNMSIPVPGKCPIHANETVVFDDKMRTIISEWQLICDRKWISSAIMTTQMFGVLAGVLISGQIGDWFGRRKAILIELTILFVSMLLLGFSVNWQMMAACIFFVGAACGAYLAIAAVYTVEFIGTEWRTSINCIPAWPVGVLFIAGGIKLFGYWRYVCYLGAVLGLPVVVAFWFLPESIRWLFVRGKIEEGKDVIRRIAKSNGREEPDLSGVDTVIQEFISDEKHEMSKYNYLTLFRYKFTRWKVLLFGFVWFYMSVSYYVIMFGVGSLHGDISLNMMLMGLVQCFGVGAVWLVSKCFGRKYTSIIALSSSALTCLGITVAFFTSSGTNFRIIQQVLAITSVFCLASSWRSVILHTLELFPTVLRGMAYASVSLFARIGGLVAPKTAALREISPHLPFTVIGIIGLLAACCILPLDDTYTTELDDYLGDECTGTTKSAEEKELINAQG